MTDADLIRSIQAGDVKALAALYERCLPVVWRYAYCRLGGRVHAAEDAVSETFLAAVDAIGRLNPDGGTLCGWLLGIARHKVSDQFRRREALLEDSADTDPQEASVADSSAPEVVMEAAETTAGIMETLDRLAKDERIALEWKYLDGLSVRDIAGRLGRTDKAIENLLHRARQSFRMLYGRRQGRTSEISGVDGHVQA